MMCLWVLHLAKSLCGACSQKKQNILSKAVWRNVSEHSAITAKFHYI